MHPLYNVSQVLTASVGANSADIETGENKS